MSFQIPGLGFAKPNETLPPLQPDIAIAAESANSSADAKAETAPNSAGDLQSATAVTDEPVVPEGATPETAKGDPDAMNIDMPLATADQSIPSTLEASAPAQEQQQPTDEHALPENTEEHPEWEVDSSPYESSSESSSSDSSDEDSDAERYELLGPEETARILMAEAASDDGMDGSGRLSGAQMRTKNELIEDAPPKPDVEITEDTKIEELGEVQHIVENIVVVKGTTTGEYQVLEYGSVLCTAERVVIGTVSETLGKVSQPLYTVLFATPDAVSECGLSVGTKIFYPPAHATFVFTQALKGKKGSDASNLHDEEIAEDECEFSDDEMEAEYKRRLKQQKRERSEKSRGQGPQGPHPLRNEIRPGGGLNYDDDDDDGPYKPLARPAGFGQGPSGMSAANEEPVPQPGGFRPRRGDFGGRGANRSRGAGRGGRGSYSGGSREGFSKPPQSGYQHPQFPAPAQYQAPPPPPNAGGYGAPTAAFNMPPYAAQQQGANVPAFNFQYPGWPQAAGAPPPSAGPSGAATMPGLPPQVPNWGNPAVPAPNAGAFMNPALIALLSQVAQQQAANQPRQGPGAGWPGVPPQPGPNP